ncbi:hypothetical protein P175DRAFT_0551483 [Aspergillus ochraceoroseus IBT 24754]|uniref:AB hydrolase-1 domain-containing protein n=3 Tax=Aspergillus subgen. Nidulantes TaxID=2720870 RepID=A0A0F8VTN7_9EURO|nr:uncharacterized protein P175DRAFT_0551483 [Aspergillus ochraceoroseus IBT 24754]KKK14460.1 hypothetical protein AOCH_003676 [Aspergillus ochraceoroseus]KKK26581.1 hypothetical protein ARAM_007287 [Aspergillus rambellii]PTU18028.1 hypothetical protein P175DRAFT_0551483 [Aspergillus ochraceoroseus IBT 24754]
MASKPTIILVPGAWHSPDCYDRVIEYLHEAGYKTEKVHLPSVGPPEHYTDFSADVAHVRKYIEKAVNAGQKVVVVVHSYGGLPGNEAIKDLDLKTRQSRGLEGGVSHLFLCCSFVVSEGSSLLGAIGDTDPSWLDVSEDKLETSSKNPVETFYNDMTEDDINHAVAALKPHSYQTFKSRCTFAAWKTVPTTYLYCLRDQAIPISAQRMMVEETGKGFGIMTETVDASHSPFYTVPSQMAGAIRRAAGENV